MTEGGTVYIIGGSGAVPDVMETELKNLGITEIQRVAGSNRYTTNIEILKEAGVSGEDIMVCSGTGYADSLSASAAGKPIFLVGKTLSKEQKEYLESISGEISGNVYAIGGTGVVSDDVFTAVCKYAPPGGEKERVAGANRYSTSWAVGEKFFPGSHNGIVLAYAMNYPDGLAGGPLAYAMDSALLLVTDKNIADAKKYASAHGSMKATIIGGEALISDAAALSVLSE